MTADDIRDRQRAFDAAELAGDTAALEKLLTDDFHSIGPKGFVLGKAEWIGRHGYFTYLTLDVSDVHVRVYGKAAVVHNIQRNTATHRDDLVKVDTRVGQFWIEQDGEWRLAAIQFSPLDEG